MTEERRSPPDPELRTLLLGIGRRIAFLRRRASLTQQEAADRAQLDLRQWGRLEAGQTNPTVKTLFAVANALGVDLRKVVEPRVERPDQPKRRGRPPRR